MTIDVSFISLRLILPPVPRAALAPAATSSRWSSRSSRPAASEVGKGGIVRDPAVHQRVIDAVVDEARGLRFVVAGLTPSPIAGAEGNREFLLHLKR